MKGKLQTCCLRDIVNPAMLVESSGIWLQAPNRAQRFGALLTCNSQVTFVSLATWMSKKHVTQHRSGCPVSISLEIFGDRWSLLIIRDLMVRGYRTFKEFEKAGEGIASNILADRLRKLRKAGIVDSEPDVRDRRQMNYRLTEKGIDLAPVLLELLIWGALHENTGAPCAIIDDLARNRAQVLKETRKRWAERDPRPILPAFEPIGGRRSQSNFVRNG